MVDSRPDYQGGEQRLQGDWPGRVSFEGCHQPS